MTTTTILDAAGAFEMLFLSLPLSLSLSLSPSLRVYSGMDFSRKRELLQNLLPVRGVEVADRCTRHWPKFNSLVLYQPRAETTHRFVSPSAFALLLASVDA